MKYSIMLLGVGCALYAPVSSAAARQRPCAVQHVTCETAAFCKALVACDVAALKESLQHKRELNIPYDFAPYINVGRTDQLVVQPMVPLSCALYLFHNRLVQELDCAQPESGLAQYTEMIRLLIESGANPTLRVDDALSPNQHCILWIPYEGSSLWPDFTSQRNVTREMQDLCNAVAQLCQVADPTPVREMCVGDAHAVHSDADDAPSRLQLLRDDESNGLLAIRA